MTEQKSPTWGHAILVFIAFIAIAIFLRDSDKKKDVQISPSEKFFYETVRGTTIETSFVDYFCDTEETYQEYLHDTTDLYAMGVPDTHPNLNCFRIDKKTKISPEEKGKGLVYKYYILSGEHSGKFLWSGNFM